MQFRPGVERIYSGANALFIDVNDEIDGQFFRLAIAKDDHLAELPSRINVKQRKRRFTRMEGLERKAQHHGRVLAYRIEHDGALAGGDDLAHDMDALGFELSQMRLAGHCEIPPTPLVLPARTRRPSAPICSPHSFCASSSHHHRPARSSSPGSTARVQGAQPIDK